MRLKKLMSVLLFAVLSSQSFASEEVRREKEEGKEEETSEQTPYPHENPENIFRYLQQRSRGASVHPPSRLQEEFHHLQEKYLRDEINRLKLELLKVYKEELLSNEEKIEKLNQAYFKIKNLLFKLMHLLNYGEDETEDLKLASFLINYYVWAQVDSTIWYRVRSQVAQVDAQVVSQIWAQVEAQISSQVGTQVRDQIRTRIRAKVQDRVFDRVWTHVGDQVGLQGVDHPWFQVGAQVRNQLRDLVFFSLEFDFESVLSGGNLNDTLRVWLHYTFMVCQIQSILKLLTPELKTIKEKIAAFLKKDFDQVQISQLLRFFQIPPYGNCPLINTQLELLRMHLPSRTDEEMISSLISFVIATAIASASASLPPNSI